MKYDPQAPPFEFESYETMKPKEAKALFDWFVSDIPHRLQMLGILIDGQVKLDFTPESLIDLYEWFLDIIEIKPMTEKMINKSIKEDIETLPDWLQEHAKEELMANSIYVENHFYFFARDISIYYAETVRRNYPEVIWDYISKPKSYAFVNQPLIRLPKNHIHFYEREAFELMLVLIEYIKEGESYKNHLYDIYKSDEADIIGIPNDESEVK